MIKRNHTYSVGDTEYSMEGFKLVCKTAGITAPTPINMGGGQTITDGTVEWEVTLGEDAMPSDVYINFPATTEYIAPANGYIIVMATASSSNSRVRIAESDWSKGQTGFISVKGWSYGTMMPCIRGHTYIVYPSDINLNDLRIRFYYSVGEAKRLGLI